MKSKFLWSTGLTEGGSEGANGPPLLSGFILILLLACFSTNAYAVAPDSDGDGVVDSTDAFPNDPAASVDSDGDGFPNYWNPGKSAADSTSAPPLQIDSWPFDASQATDSDSDGIDDGWEKRHFGNLTKADTSSDFNRDGMTDLISFRNALFPGTYPKLSGKRHNLAVKSDGTVVAWGMNFHGQATVPAGLTDVVAVANGITHSLALKSDGTVVGWGDNSEGQISVPAGLTGVKAIAAGWSHSLALKSDGTVVAWGTSWLINVPAGLTDVVAISAGTRHSFALKTDGTMVGWGQNEYGLFDTSAGQAGVTSIRSGSSNVLVQKSAGTVEGWGYNVRGQNNPPAGLNGVIDFDTGFHHSLALKSNGTVVMWGGNSRGQQNVPAGLSGVAAVEAGHDHSLALKYDGTVVAWGDNVQGQLNVPVGLILDPDSDGDGVSDVWDPFPNDTSRSSDATVPVITLLGASPVAIEQNATYNDRGATAVDDVDGVITANIAVVNSVDTAMVGTYTVTYDVSDAAGNVAQQVVRTVEVLPTGNAAARSMALQQPLTGSAASVEILATGEIISAFSSAAAVGTPPSGMVTPFGVISYSTTATNATQMIKLSFSSPLPAGAQLYKVDGADTYTLIPNGAAADQWTQTDAYTIALTLTDGGIFDLDGVVNGIIIDPVAVVSSATSSATTSTGVGGGGCVINPNAKFDPVMPLLALIAAGFAWLRRRQQLSNHS